MNHRGQTALRATGRGSILWSDKDMKIEKLAAGSGGSPKSGEAVTVHYTSWLTDGSQFDSSVDRGEPFAFVLGAGEVIQGWDAGVATMRVGDIVSIRSC
jgi:FKBP-type peptidyl-prolyl cis-trans isomerase FkpA